jgi:hypothetical protein
MTTRRAAAIGALLFSLGGLCLCRPRGARIAAGREPYPRFRVTVPDQVNLKLELDVESDECEFEIELTW